jgi:hypothetical protein
VDNYRSRLAVLEVMNVIRSPREWIYGHSDGPDFCGTEECRDEFRRIREQDQDAVASRYALREQGIPHAIGKRCEF